MLRRVVIMATVLAALASTGVAKAQSQGDILRHMADCEDDYKVLKDYSAYLRCMADVQDEIDRMRTGSEVRQQDWTQESQPGWAQMVHAAAQYRYSVCVERAKGDAEKEQCKAAFHKAVGPLIEPRDDGPNIQDAGTPHGEFVKCMYYAQTSAEIDKCNADYKAAQAAPPPPIHAGLPIGPNSYPECSQRDPSITEQECNNRLTPDAPVLSACRRFATEPEGTTQPEAYRLCAVRVGKR